MHHSQDTTQMGSLTLEWPGWASRNSSSPCSTKSVRARLASCSPGGGGAEGGAGAAGGAGPAGGLGRPCGGGGIMAPENHSRPQSSTLSGYTLLVTDTPALCIRYFVSSGRME